MKISLGISSATGMSPKLESVYSQPVDIDQQAIRQLAQRAE